MDAMQFEPMSVSRILDRTFALYKRNFLRFITIVAIIQVPLALISLVIGALSYEGMPARSEIETRTAQLSPAEATHRADRSDYKSPIGLMVAGAASTAVLILTTIVGKALCQAALARSISEAYLGNEITVGQTYRSVLPQLLSLIGASLFVGLVTGLGFLLLVVPGVIFGLWLFLTTTSIVIENHGTFAGMSRSKALTSGNLGKVFAVGFLAAIIGWIIMIPIGMATQFVSMLLIHDNGMLRIVVGQLGSMVGEVFAAPIFAAASVLLYYDLRIRKEGFDLQMLAQSMVSNRG